ncbi:MULTISPECIES: aminotransferase class V-fold PLP-dependent enzyme [unclassified Streptomyces]|uniref:aminotransferase class V-fold PLP-dependent enzyme n=1 Tax=unclassified Streptomyces TaxID=2593676 RepID=UPI002E17B24B|nr:MULTISPECIES: aminotransferase class V-fold PLP-dependent enzyme [unclassified Streptomyces]
MRTDPVTRRAMLGRSAAAGGALALGPLFAGEAVAADGAAPKNGAAAKKGGYERIGVRPLINGRGTYTVLSGSLILPEVREAIDAASRQYVQLDELADGVGRRLGELTGAEFGMVSSGCSAALTHASAACTAGGNPDLHIQIPDLSGFTKTEAVIPKHSRNVYEAAISAVGLKVVEVATREEMKAALGPQTALVYVFAMPRVDESELDLKTIAELAHAKDVPVLVDAAAEVLTIPNVHLERGADLVAYSGGKALRGPQSAGILLGRKDLVRAAWVHSAPHHGYARGFKVGKEEAMGMLAAVEMWVRRDHKAEYAKWTSWLRTIAKRVSAAVPGVTSELIQPEGLSNRTPTLNLFWDAKKRGVVGQTIVDALWEGEPRIAINPASSKDPALSGLAVTPYMLEPGDEKTIADHIVKRLKNPPPAPAKPKPPSVDASGTWSLEITYAAGASSAHELTLKQDGAKLTGTHRGDFVSRSATGSVSADEVTVSSSYGEEHGDSLSYTFTGKLTGDAMSGSVDLGEYLKGSWKATRKT